MKKLTTIFLLSVIACTKQDSDVLKLGFVPSAEAEKIATTVKPLEEILSRKLGMEVKSYLMNDYTSTIEAIGSGRIDIAFLPPLAYVLAKQRYDVEVIVKALRNNRAFYRGQFVVRNTDNIRTLKDLEGGVWAYPDAASTSGFLFPKYYMMKQGIDPDKFFKDRIQTGSHDNAILAVYNGEADLATTFEGAEQRLLKDYKDVLEKIKIIAYTDSIPNDGVVVRKDMDEELKKKIKQAFLELNEDTLAMKILKRVYYWDGIIPASDEDYEIVRQVAEFFRIRAFR